MTRHLNTGEVNALPDSAPWIHGWEPFWVELWVSTPQSTTGGIAGGTVDVCYDTRFVSPSRIEYGPAFANDHSGIIDDASGLVDDVGGTTNRTDVGDNGHALLARIQLEPTSADQAPVDEAGHFIGPYEMGFRLADDRIELVGLGPTASTLGPPPGTDLFAVPYEVDDSGRIDFGDFSHFVPAFGLPTGGVEPPLTWWADYDKSGQVDFGDFSYFAPNFAEEKPSNELILPSSFPAAWVTAKGTADAPASADLAAQEEKLDPLINVELTAVASPTPGDELAALPESLDEVPVGGTCFVEIWVQDVADAGVGIAGGYVDLGYTTSRANAVALDHGGLFTTLTSGSIDDAAGLIDDFGGGTFTADLGIAPNWARLGYIECQVTAAGEIAFTLAPGSLPFSRWGAGNVPWENVAFGDLTLNPAAPGSLNGSVFDDLDRDGARDPGEPGLADWTVQFQLVSSTPELTFENPTPDDRSQFSRFVAVVGDDVLVGSHYDDVAGPPDSGAAYLFDGSTGELLHTYVSPAPAERDKFGRAVAGLGDNVLIGAPLDDTVFEDTGAVYLFDGQTGELLHAFVNPNPRPNDQFGRAVAAVGDNVLIGARMADVMAPGGEIEDAGVAFLFDGRTGDLLQTYLSPTPSQNGQFGYSVAAMGENVLVGARWDETGANGVGAVYLFDGATGNLLLSLHNPVISSTGEPSDFGRSVAALGDNVLVGARYDDSAADRAGSAFLFEGSSGILLHTFTSPTPAPGEQFGFCVAALGNDVLVGAQRDFRCDGLGDGNGGAVYLFDGSTGELLQTIANPSPGAWDEFGVAVVGMDDRILVGAQYGNAAYLFGPSPAPVLTDSDGNYSLTELEAGTYRIRQVLQNGYVQTLPGGSGTYMVTLEAGGVLSGLDFGNVEDEIPVAQDDSYSVTEDFTLTVAPAEGVLRNDTDADGDPLTASVVNAPPHGTLILLPDGSFSYTPDQDFNGSESFTYRANDGVADSNLATVTITVEPVNDAPVAHDDYLWVPVNWPRTVEPPGVLADDVDVEGNPLTASLVDLASHGTLMLEPDGSFTYTPELDYLGPDSFTYQANDGMADSNVATVHITITDTAYHALIDFLRITELNYNPYLPTPSEWAMGISNRDAFEFIELQNTGSERLYLDGVQLTQGVELQFIHLNVLEPGEYAVLVKDQFAFEARYGSGLNVVGQYSGDLHNSGERIVLKDPFDQTILDFHYESSGDWPYLANGFGPTLEVIDPYGDYNDGANWRYSIEYGGTPGAEGVGTAGSLVINEVLAHTDPPLTDAIELYNPTDSPIDVSGWYLSDSCNNYKKFRIPEGTTIGAGGYLVFDESDFNPPDPAPGRTRFRISRHGWEPLYVTAADADGNVTMIVDHVEFDPTMREESLGRWPTYQDELYPMESITLGGPNSGPRVGPILIGEVMYNPPDPADGIDPDDLEFMEIYNPTGETLDTTNWRIRGGVTFDFPYTNPFDGAPPDNPVLVDPRETLLVVGFPVGDTPELAAFRDYYGIDPSVQIVGPYDGRLDDGGDRLRLIRPDRQNPVAKYTWLYVLEDEVIYDDEAPWPARAAGGGDSLNRAGIHLWGNDPTSWAAALPTPGTPSVGAGNLAITELNYNPYDPTPAELAISENFDNDDFEFIELVNVGGEPIDVTGVELAEGIGFTFTGGTLAPDQRVVVVNNLVAFELRYGTGINVAGEYGRSLGNGGEQIVLIDSFGRPILDFVYDNGSPWPGRADGKGSSLEVIDTGGNYNNDDNWRSSNEYGGSPGYAGTGPLTDVVVNEVLSQPVPGDVDAIELYNTTDGTIDIGGWYLSDSSGNYQKFRIPDGTSIPPGGYLVFDEYDFNPTMGADPNDFTLDGVQGDDVWLLQANPADRLTRFADHVEFDAAAQGESFGRWPNGHGELYPMQSLALGGENSAPRVGPVLISEVMYHSPDPVVLIDPDDLEFVEIYNPTGETLDLTNWRICGGIDFDFPDGTLLAAHQTLLVVRFDPGNIDTLRPFRIYYGIDESVDLVGGYSGRLSNDSETVQLRRAGEEPPNVIPYLLEDEVNYSDSAPWPTDADGGGSLHRRAADLWGNDAESWTALMPTPGSTTLFVPGLGEVVGRHVFYNNSAFDGNNSAPNPQDDAAIAIDKHALLPGQTATSSNYTGYSRGINGIMVDVGGLPGTPTASDFAFKVGNDDTPDAWNDSPGPTSVTVRPGEGVNGSDRVTIIWPDHAIQKQWLQVTVLAGGNTGLVEDDAFYFGNAIGECGNSTTDAEVNATDMFAARNNLRTFINPAPVDFDYDYNHDARVNATDMLIARNNQTSFLDALQLITVPPIKASGAEESMLLKSLPGEPSLPAIRLDLAEGRGQALAEKVTAYDTVLEGNMGKESGNRQISPAKLDWLYEFELMGTNRQPTKKEKMAEDLLDKVLVGDWQ